MRMHVTCVMGLQVGAQWAVEQEAIQIGSVTADFAQPTSEQQVRLHSKPMRLIAQPDSTQAPPDTGSLYEYSWC